MPRNGSGSYNLPQPPFQPNTTIESAVMNSNLNDIATAIGNSLAKDGQTTPTANLPMGSFRHTGVSNAAARNQYAAVGQVQDSSFTWCGTAGGIADAITLAPAIGIGAYAAGQAFQFIPSVTNTGAVTVAVSGLGTKAVTKSGAIALSAGDLDSSRVYEITYDGTRFQLASDPLGTYAPLASPSFTGVPTAPTATAGTSTTQLATTAFVQAASGGVSGVFTNLRLSASGTSSSVPILYDEISVESAGNAYKTLRNGSLTLNTSASGVNGLDAGSVAINTWYSVWVIYNPTTSTAASLMSTSATAPTLPTDYTFQSRIGWIRTDSSANKYPLGFTQRGRDVQYKVAAGSNVASLPLIKSGTAGTWAETSAPTWEAESVSTFVPTTAGKISLLLGTTYNNLTASNVAVAPNNDYSGVSTTNIPPIVARYSGTPGSPRSITVSGSLVIESTNIYFVSEFSGGSLMCLGWEDNL